MSESNGDEARISRFYMNVLLAAKRRGRVRRICVRKNRKKQKDRAPPRQLNYEADVVVFDDISYGSFQISTMLTLVDQAALPTFVHIASQPCHIRFSAPLLSSQARPRDRFHANRPGARLSELQRR